MKNTENNKKKRKTKKNCRANKSCNLVNKKEARTPRPGKLIQ